MQKLREIRSAAGLTQVQLAERSGVDQRTISYHETKAKRGPHPGNAAKLAAALGCDPADLMKEARQEIGT